MKQLKRKQNWQRSVFENELIPKFLISALDFKPEGW